MSTPEFAFGEWCVSAPEPADADGWRRVFASYGGFYGVPMPGEKLDRVWIWLQDPSHEMRGFVLKDAEGMVRGLAHCRPFARPLHGNVGCFLDDLLVEPGIRGDGGVDALFAAVGAVTLEEGWSVIRGITADNNFRARARYEAYGTRTMWVTYDWSPNHTDVEAFEAGSDRRSQR